MFKFLIDKLIKNNTWTSLGKYMEPRINFDLSILSPWGGYCSYKLFSCEIHVKDKYINDKGIQEHELAHSRQYGRLFWIHSGLSMVWGKYRLFVELECYRHQVSNYNYSSKSQYDWIVRALDEKYNTGVSKDRIQELADYTFSDLITSSSTI